MNHPDDLTLQAWHDDELDGDAREALRGHIEGCADCQARLDALRVLRGAAQRWAEALPALPDDFAELVAARAFEQPEARGPSSAETSAMRPAAKVIPLRRWVYPALAAAAAGVIALSVALPRRGTSRDAPAPTLVATLNDEGGGAKVTRVDIPGAQSFTVMQLQGIRPDTVTALVWIQDPDEGGGSP